MCTFMCVYFGYVRIKRPLMYVFLLCVCVFMCVCIFVPCAFSVCAYTQCVYVLAMCVCQEAMNYVCMYVLFVCVRICPHVRFQCACAFVCASP